MRATLHITAGAYAGRKISLRDGEIAQFGRTEWADYSFPADNAMADRHFRVQCSPRQCVVQDLQSHSGTLVDGREVTQTVIGTGNIITAGQTCFLVVLGDDPLPGTKQAGPPASALPANGTAGNLKVADIDVLALCKRAKLPKGVAALLVGATDIVTAVNTLLSNKFVDEALGLVAVALQPADAVRWASSHLQATLTERGIVLDEANANALQLTLQWLAKPSDELARQCEAAAQSLELETAAAWAAFSAFFAQGNLASADSDPIVVPPGVCGNAARTCLVMTSALRPVAEISLSRRKYIADALTMLAAKPA